MKSLVAVTVFLAAVSMALGQIGDGVTPAGMKCDIGDIITWVNGDAANLDYWENLAVTRDFQELCSAVDIWVVNVAGCVNFFTNVLTAFGVTIPPEFDYFNYGMAMVQFYCGISTPTKVCNVNAISGCASATVGTFQQMVAGTVEDVAMICQTYSMVLDAMSACVTTAISECDDDEKSMVMADFDLVYNYFEIVKDYCGAECGNWILLASNQMENCDYVEMLMNFEDLEFSEYCTYIQQVLDCVWGVYEDCPIASPENTAIGVTGIVAYADVLGCTNTVGPIGLDDLDDDMVNVVLPDCVAGPIMCVQAISTAMGISQTAGPYGGYDVSGVVSQANAYFDRMVSGQVADICYLGDDIVWETVTMCADTIIDSCPTGSVGEMTQMIINTEITSYVDQACSEGCIALQPAIEGYLECTAYLRTEEIDITDTTTDILTGLFAPGGANIEICEMVRGYADCILPFVKDCPLLYDNYVKLVSMYSNVVFVIGACNIELNLKTGEIGESANSNNMLIHWSGGSQVEASFALVLSGVMWIWMH